jgi:curli biogenesis system outer membrane secretion channel CsgG
LASGLETITVESRGYGGTLNEAIIEALEEAIGRVNGKTLDTQTQLSSLEQSTTQEGHDERLLDESFQKKVTSATKGIVNGYELLEEIQGPQGWEVRLRVQVVRFSLKPSTKRKKLVVFPFQVKAQSLVIDGETVDPETVAWKMNQQLVSFLVQTRKFTVLDRGFISERRGEQQLIESGNTSVQALARLGQDLVADYVIVGVVENFGFALREQKMRMSDRTFHIPMGQMTASIRIIEVDTGQISFSGTFGLDWEQAKNAVDHILPGTDGILSAFAQAISEAMAKRILDQIFPLLIVGVQAPTVVIGQGGQGIRENEIYDVFAYGEPIKDPYTQEVLGREENRIGSIKVVRVNPKHSQGVILEGQAEIEQRFGPRKLICRGPLLSTAKDPTLAPTKNANEEQRAKTW